MSKLVTLTCLASFAASTAIAGGMAEPIDMAPIEIIEDTAGSVGSSSGLIVPLILIALIAAAASGSSSSNEYMTPDA